MENNLEISLITLSKKKDQKTFKALETVVRYFSAQKFRAEIILVDVPDESKIERPPKGSFLPAIFFFNYSVTSEKSLYAAVKAAKGQYIFMVDADLSTPIFEVEKFLRYLQSGEEVIVGSRRMGFSKVTRPTFAALLDEICQLWTRFLGLTDLTDARGSFRAFSANAAKVLYSKATTQDDLLDVETLLLARELHFRMIEIPISWQEKEKAKREELQFYLQYFLRLTLLKLKLAFLELSKRPHHPIKSFKKRQYLN